MYMYKKPQIINIWGFSRILVEMAGVEPETIKHYQLLLNYRL